MNFLRIFNAVYQALQKPACFHSRMVRPEPSAKGLAHCPDCGYVVRWRWNLCRCRTCGSRRPIRQDLGGSIRPQDRYCRQCGQSDYRLIQKEQLHGYELPFAILTREIDYLDRQIDSGFSASTIRNPFQGAIGQAPWKTSAFNVVEGTLLSKEELLRDDFGGL